MVEQKSKLDLNESIKALSSVNRVLLSNFDIATVVQQVVDEIHKQLISIDDRYRIVVLSLVDKQGEYLVRTSLTVTEEGKATMAASEIEFRNIKIPMSATQNLGVKTILENKEMVTTSFVDILCPPLTPQNALEVQKSGGIKTSYVFPVIVDDKPLGSMIFSMKKTIEEIEPAELELIRGFVLTVGLSISNANLFEEVRMYQKKLEKSSQNLKTQNQNLEIALQKIQQIRQQEQDMIDILGHELRTPITVVRNALSVLEMDIKPDQLVEPEKLNTYIDRALRATKREMVLIETLLAATKIDANRVQLRLEKIDLNEIVQDTFDAHLPVAQERHLDLIAHMPKSTDHLYIYADRVRTQEILDNFVSNALKYTMKGSVEIYFEEVQSVQNDTPQIKVSVKDSGIGIPEEDIAKLGRKFFRARQYISEDQGEVDIKVSGTGLGLYVSFELIKIMDGEISITSKLGEGSTFSFSLPKYTGQEVKNIDQTFNNDDELEKKLREKMIPESEINELINNATDSNQEVLNNTTTQKPTAPKDQADAEAEKAGLKKRLSSANDIMQKINEGRKYLDESK